MILRDFLRLGYGLVKISVVKGEWGEELYKGSPQRLRDNELLEARVVNFGTVHSILEIEIE